MSLRRMMLKYCWYTRCRRFYSSDMFSLFPLTELLLEKGSVSLFFLFQDSLKRPSRHITIALSFICVSTAGRWICTFKSLREENVQLEKFSLSLRGRSFDVPAIAQAGASPDHSIWTSMHLHALKQSMSERRLRAVSVEFIRMCNERHVEWLWMQTPWFGLRTMIVRDWNTWGQGYWISMISVDDIECRFEQPILFSISIHYSGRCIWARGRLCHLMGAQQTPLIGSFLLQLIRSHTFCMFENIVLELFWRYSRDNSRGRIAQ